LEDKARRLKREQKILHDRDEIRARGADKRPITSQQASRPSVKRRPVASQETTGPSAKRRLVDVEDSCSRYSYLF